MRIRSHSVTRLSNFFFFRKSHSNESNDAGDPEGIVNLLHYADASSATLKVLENLKDLNNIEDNIVLVSDGNKPITRKQICEITVEGKKWKGKRDMPEFIGGETKRGRPEKEERREYIPSGELLKGWEGGRSFSNGMN